MGCTSDIEEDDLDLDALEEKDTLQAKQIENKLNLMQKSCLGSGASWKVSESQTKDVETKMTNMHMEEEYFKEVFNKPVLGQEEIFKEKAREIFVDKAKRETNEIVDVGHFCAAWMDCFESITELDNNL